MEQKSKEINGTTYLVSQMDGLRALKAQTQLISILGKGLVEVLGKKAKNAEDILAALMPVIDKFDDEKANGFVLSLFDKGVFIEKVEKGQKIPEKLDFEEHFCGKGLEIWKVVAFILETNFSMGKSTGSNSLTTGQDKQTPES